MSAWGLDSHATGKSGWSTCGGRVRSCGRVVDWVGKLGGR